MRLLRMVDVCGREYRIVEQSAAENPELDGVDGLCDHDNATIYITPGKAETVQIDTLFHELLHACIEATRLRAELQSREKDRPVGRLMTAFLRFTESFVTVFVFVLVALGANRQTIPALTYMALIGALLVALRNELEPKT